MAASSNLPSSIDSQVAVSCFKSNRTELLAIKQNLPKLSSVFYSKGLITCDIHEKASIASLTITERANTILDCLENAVKLKSSNFSVIIKVIEEEDKFFEPLVQKLVSSYNDASYHTESTRREDDFNVARQDSGYSGSMARSLSELSSITNEAPPVQNVLPSASSPLDKPLGAADHSAIFRYLEDLTKQNIIDIGVQLGLKYAKLTDLSGGSVIKNEVIQMWLNRNDYVLDKSGIPTWRSLIKALEDNGFRGIADKIINGIGSSVHEQ